MGFIGVYKASFSIQSIWIKFELWLVCLPNCIFCLWLSYLRHGKRASGLGRLLGLWNKPSTGLHWCVQKFLHRSSHSQLLVCEVLLRLLYQEVTLSALITRLFVCMKWYQVKICFDQSKQQILIGSYSTVPLGKMSWYQNHKHFTSQLIDHWLYLIFTASHYLTTSSNGTAYKNKLKMPVLRNREKTGKVIHIEGQ